MSPTVDPCKLLLKADAGEAWPTAATGPTPTESDGIRACAFNWTSDDFLSLSVRSGPASVAQFVAEADPRAEPLDGIGEAAYLQSAFVYVAVSMYSGGMTFDVSWNHSATRDLEDDERAEHERFLVALAPKILDRVAKGGVDPETQVNSTLPLVLKSDPNDVGHEYMRKVWRAEAPWRIRYDANSCGGHRSLMIQVVPTGSTPRDREEFIEVQIPYGAEEVHGEHVIGHSGEFSVSVQTACSWTLTITD